MFVFTAKPTCALIVCVHNPTNGGYGGMFAICVCRLKKGAQKFKIQTSAHQKNTTHNTHTHKMEYVLANTTIFPRIVRIMAVIEHAHQVEPAIHGNPAEQKEFVDLCTELYVNKLFSRRLFTVEKWTNFHYVVRIGQVERLRAFIVAAIDNAVRLANTDTGVAMRRVFHDDMGWCGLGNKIMTVQGKIVYAPLFNMIRAVWDYYVTQHIKFPTLCLQDDDRPNFHTYQPPPPIVGSPLLIRQQTPSTWIAPQQQQQLEDVPQQWKLDELCLALDTTLEPLFTIFNSISIAPEHKNIRFALYVAMADCAQKSKDLIEIARM